jgi:hypothetical protein
MLPVLENTPIGLHLRCSDEEQGVRSVRDSQSLPYDKYGLHWRKKDIICFQQNTVIIIPRWWQNVHKNIGGILLGTSLDADTDVFIVLEDTQIR